MTLRIAKGLIGVGSITIASAFLVDLIGIGEGGVQAAQLTGVQLGGWLVIMGASLLLAQREANLDPLTAGRQVLYQVFNQPVWVWVVLGFLITYLFLFVIPVFFDPVRRIQYFYRYIPDIAPIGHDLIFNTGKIKEWLVDGIGLYDAPGHYYPPLYSVLFAPFVLLTYPDSYFLMTAITLISAVLALWVIPALALGRRAAPLILFFFLTTIFSYGLQFELERGQFNLLSFAMCLLAIYIYHFHHAFRFFAYALFSLTVQIKIYPAIFILLLIRDFRDWRNNLIRFLGLGLINFALLFVLGIPTFAGFIQEIATHMGLDLTFPGNHSLRSFIYNLSNARLGLHSLQPENWLVVHSNFVGFLFLAIFIACLLAMLINGFLRNQKGFNADLLLVCTIGALILPSVSVDYKLPLLAAPITFCLADRLSRLEGIKRFAAILLVVVISSAYTITLFPYTYRPGWLAISLPLLFIILVAGTALHFLDTRNGIQTPQPLPAE